MILYWTTDMVKKLVKLSFCDIFQILFQEIQDKQEAEARGGGDGTDPLDMDTKKMTDTMPSGNQRPSSTPYGSIPNGQPQANGNGEGRWITGDDRRGQGKN